MESAAATERDRQSRARLGITLRSKWHLDTLLGIGGMAAVYAATHRNGNRGAVKIMHLGAREPETRHRFLREGRIANHVQHDGIVSVLDDDVAEDGSPFLVMELLDGESFSERAARTGNKLSADVVLLLTDQVLDALAAAHDKGIVHRDIKPEKLFVTTDARVKVLDFGIAHLAESLETQLRATQLGTAMGTPAFMPPEQARGDWNLVGPESDLWSLGATMFTLLTSEFVHEEASLHELLAATITKRARSLAVALPGAPAQIVQIVDRALELNIADRWHDAREMQTAVRAAYLAMTGAKIPEMPTPRSTPDDGGGRSIVSHRRVATMVRAAGTISAVATRLAAGARRPRQRGAIVVGALALACGIAAFVTLRAPASAPVASAQSLAIPEMSPTLPDPAIAIVQPDAGPHVELTATTMTTTPSAKGASPVVSAAPLPDRNPKRLFDRRR